MSLTIISRKGLKVVDSAGDIHIFNCAEASQLAAEMDEDTLVIGSRYVADAGKVTEIDAFSRRPTIPAPATVVGLFYKPRYAVPLP